MSTKIVTLPKKEIEVQGVGKRNIFTQLLLNVAELTPQKTDTETFLSHALREKIESLNGSPTLELEEAEIHFLQGGVEKLRAKDAVAGSDWYFFVQPLRDAVDKKTFERKQAKDK